MLFEVKEWGYEAVFDWAKSLLKKANSWRKKLGRLKIGAVIIGTFFLAIGLALIITNMTFFGQQTFQGFQMADIMVFLGIVMLLPSLADFSRFKKSTQNHAKKVRATSGLAAMGYAFALLVMGILLSFQGPGSFPQSFLSNPLPIIFWIGAVEVIVSLVFIRKKNIEDLEVSGSDVANQVQIRLWAYLIFFVITDSIIAFVLQKFLFPDLKLIIMIPYMLALKFALVALFLLLGAKIGSGRSKDSPIGAIKEATNGIFLVMLIVIVLMAVSLPAYFLFMQTNPEIDTVISVENPMLGDLFSTLRETGKPTQNFVTQIAQAMVPDNIEDVKLNVNLGEIMGRGIWTGVFDLPTTINGKKIPNGQILSAMIMFLAMFFFAVRITSESKVSYEDIENTSDDESVKEILKRLRQVGKTKK